MHLVITTYILSFQEKPINYKLYKKKPSTSKNKNFFCPKKTPTHMHLRDFFTFIETTNYINSDHYFNSGLF